MADIDEIKKDVDKLKDKVSKLEIDITTSLGQIKNDLVEIKTFMQNNSKTNDLKNELIEKDVKNNTKEIDALKSNQNKIVWTIVLAFLGLIGEAVIYYIQNKP